MTFRNHLRTREYVDLAIAKTAQHAFVIAQMTHRVTVDASDTRIWKVFLQVRFEPFCAFSDVMDVLAVAFRTRLRRATRKPTVVTQELVDRFVVGQADTARTALEG